ncbi:hypothetical protein LCGC14_2746840 [marine sediment metagenome]|uniref:Uncharacterized protein n=1 Tax=marine sediment metagenome TaxID=412755 RepID=A0A0F8Z2T4_9ZZZZ
MANPVLAKVIGVKVSAANVGEYVIVRNLTRGGKLTGPLAGTDRNTVLNPAPDSEWQNGDLIQAEIRGRLQGVAQRKIVSGGVQFSAGDLGAAADTTTPGVTL